MEKVGLFGKHEANMETMLILCFITFLISL